MPDKKDPKELVEVEHKQTGGIFTTTRLALEEVWSKKGWSEVKKGKTTAEVTTMQEQPRKEQ